MRWSRISRCGIRDSLGDGNVEPELGPGSGRLGRQQWGLVITRRAINMVAPHLIRPVALVGDGVASMLKYARPVDSALFGLAAQH